MYNGFVAALGSYAAVAGTLRLHDMGFSGISFGAPDADGLFRTSFTRGQVYVYATAAYAAILLIMSLYAARLVFLRLEKPKPTVTLCAVLSVTLPAVIALSLFDILPFESITHLTFIVTGLLLFITVTVSDRYRDTICRDNRF